MSTLNENSFLYCAKNVLMQYQMGDHKVRDCDGPYGSGIDLCCLGKCTQACDTKEKLIITVGTLVLKDIEI